MGAVRAPAALEVVVDAEGSALAQKLQAVARLSHVELKVRAAAKGARTPCGLPVAELTLANGLKVRHTNAILRRLAQSGPTTTPLTGDFIQEGQVDMWLEWVTMELEHSGPCADLAQVGSVLEAHLKSRDYLVGERLTLADVSAVFSLRDTVFKAGAADAAGQYPNMSRWYQACTAQAAGAAPGATPGARPGARAPRARGPPQCAPPAFAYEDGDTSSKKPAAVYWAWFRKALASRIHAAARAAGVSAADAQAAILTKPTACGVVSTCEELLKLSLSEHEEMHMMKAPVDAAWLRKVLQ